jgi:serine/threonine-protein kinase
LATGGEPVSLSDAPTARGGTWDEDGNIIAALDSQTGWSQIAVETGRVVPLTELAPGETSHRWPHALPGGKAVVFNNNSAWGNHDESGISVLSLSDHKWKTLLEHAGMNPRYLRSGQLVFVSNGTLFAATFDLNPFGQNIHAARL